MHNIRCTEEWDELCPIFLEDDGIFEQIGTGVLIEIRKNTFLLTAAHVIDELYKSQSANLLIPTIDGFSRITGTLFHRHLRENESREDDKVDFSFYKLSFEMVSDLHKDIVPLKEHQIDLSNDFTIDVNFLGMAKMNYKKVPNATKEIYSESNQLSNETIEAMNSLICDVTIIFAGYPSNKTKKWHSSK